MQGHFVYGKLESIWIFPRVETAKTLARLWVALRDAKTWGELRHAIGDSLTRMSWEISGFTQYPGDNSAFDAVPIVREYANSWSVYQLLKITASKIPHMADIVQTHDFMKLLSQYLQDFPEIEARIVLQLAEFSCLATRDDDRIAQCLAVPTGCLTQ